MTTLQWAYVRKYWYRYSPLLQAILIYYGVTSAEEVGLWFGFVSAIIISVTNTIAAKHVDVSRETLPDDPDESVSEYIVRTTPTDVSRETISVPCVAMHGAAEPHVLGCEGWRESAG